MAFHAPEDLVANLTLSVASMCAEQYEKGFQDGMKAAMCNASLVKIIDGLKGAYDKVVKERGELLEKLKKGDQQ